MNVSDLTSRLPHWIWPGDDRPTDEIDDEVREELAFHLESLADEQTRGGALPEDAKRRAAERFGDFNKYLRLCRKEKQGDAPMLRRVQAALIAVLTAFVGLMGWQQWKLAEYYEGTHLVMMSATDRLAMIESTLARLEPTLVRPTTSTAYSAQAPTSTGHSDPATAFAPGDEETVNAAAGWRGAASDPYAAWQYDAQRVIPGWSPVKRQPTKADLTGVVTTASGEPLADADVLLVIKTWPNNRFRQNDKAVKTNGEGRFTLKRAIPLDGQYGVNAAVVAPGHAIASRYVLVEDPAGEPPEDFDFRLNPSTPIQLRLTNAGGEPLAKTFVAPRGRNDADNEDHVVYFQGSRAAWRKTDDNGVAEIDWFAAGDFGTIATKPRGADWQEHNFETPSDPDQVVTIVCDTKGR